MIRSFQTIKEIYLTVLVLQDIQFPMSELIMVNIGSAGIRIGHQTWQKLALEHEIDIIGQKQDPPSSDPVYNDSVLFSETSKGKHTPLTIFADTDPDVVDEVKRSQWKNMYGTGNMLCGKEDAANNYIRGHYTIGRDIREPLYDKICGLIQKCDNYQGMIINCSMGGGTGSGITTGLVERLSINSVIAKKAVILNMVTPSPQISNCVIQPYNFVLGFSDVNSMSPKGFVEIMYDNQQLYELCHTQLQIQDPGYHQINSLIAKAITLYTNRLRVADQPQTLRDFSTNTVPYPRMNILTPYIQNFTQIIPNSTHVINQLYDFDNSMSSFGKELQSTLLSSYTMLRGQAQHLEVIQAIRQLRSRLNFVSWVPTGLKVSISPKKVETPALEGIVLNNNSNTVHSLLKSQLRKWDELYAKRAFVHWLVGEGLSEGFMGEAYENCLSYIRDYEQFDQPMEGQDDQD